MAAEAQAGKEIARGLFLRLPTMEDAERATDFVNALVEEDAMILMDSRAGVSDEARWLEENLQAIALGNKALYFVEEGASGRIVAAFNVSRGRWRRRLAGEFGIAIARGERGKGLGTKLGRIAIREARRMGMRTLHLTVFEGNAPAIALYRKLGFRREGVLRGRVLYKGRLRGELSMSRRV